MAKNGKEAWTILLIGAFAEDYIVDIACEAIKSSAQKCVKNSKYDVLYQVLYQKKKDEKLNNLSGDATNSENEQGIETFPWGKGYKVFPLFVCEKIDDLRANGLKCPYEFVIERKDLFDGEKFKAVDLLGQRIVILVAQNKGGIDIETFRDWMAGVMRKYLFLDDTAHGISGFIDPKDPNWSWENWFKREKECKWWRARFSNGMADEHDPLGRLKSLMNEFWPKYFGVGGLSLANIPAGIDDSTKKLLNKIYNIGVRREDVPIDERLPLSHGDRARFVTPTGKIHVLLIDDDAGNSVLLDECTYNECKKKRGNEEPEVIKTTSSRDKELESMLRRVDSENIADDEKNQKKRWKENDYKDAWEQFDKIFSVQPFELKPEDFPNLENNLRQILNSHLSYDFALVDLCFGEDPGQDPLGYHVIKKIAKLFPHMPIVVYSRYKDMGHISRAFQCGAKWFLEKGEEQKLARHLMDLVKRGSWKREWRAMQEYNPVEFIYTGKDAAFDDKFRHTEEWQYLTAKSLEFFPGKFIEVKKMGGGISTASTFSVQRGLKLDGNPLQSPMIIKIDTAPNTRMEYERYFRYIRPYMANEAGRVEKPSIIIDRDCSAIVYTFAGRQDQSHALDSMKNMLKEDIVFKASCDYEKYRKAFDMIFDEILPKIHRVTPNREFGDGEKNRHQEVFSKPAALDAGEAPGAAFPNLQFGEVEEKDFFQTYLMRFPHFGKRVLPIDAFKYDQPTLEQIKANALVWDGDNERTLHPYEFHSVWVNGDGSMDLEVYDCLDDNRPYLLTGQIATHVAKFRRHMYPGSVLWVCGAKDVTGPDVQRECMFADRVSKNDQWIKYILGYSGKRYNKKQDACKCSGTEYFEFVDDVLSFCRALYGTLPNNEVREHFCGQMNGLFGESEAKNFFEHIRDRFKCPIAICHGDLNFGNVMLESRKHPPKDEKPDVSQTVTDAWLIDFARTRRDMIAHDFNVMFTDAFALMFDERLFKDEMQDYDEKLRNILPRFIHDAMFAKNPNPPDYLEGDARFVFVYKILRRIRKAALEAGMSEEMYTLTTVLECLLSLKLHLNWGKGNIRASAALFAVAKICFEKLCEEVQLDLLSMDKDGKTNKDRRTS